MQAGLWIYPKIIEILTPEIISTILKMGLCCLPISASTNTVYDRLYISLNHVVSLCLAGSLVLCYNSMEI